MATGEIREGEKKTGEERGRGMGGRRRGEEKRREICTLAFVISSTPTCISYGGLYKMHLYLHNQHYSC
jgi:hypothetical protein